MGSEPTRPPSDRETRPLMATVTIIMPTYDRTDLIGEAIESALAQTYGDFVLTIGDNGSNPETERIVESYGDPRLRYHRNEVNLGPQGNWLDLARRAETPLVASLHDDDRWEPDFLEALVPQLLVEPDIDMVFSDYWLMDGDGVRLTEATEKESAINRRAQLAPGRVPNDLATGLRLVMAWNAPQPAYAAIFRKDALVPIEFPPEAEPLYDIWFSYQIVRRGGHFRYDARRLANYRIHVGQTTKAGFARPEDWIFQTVLEAHQAEEPEACAEIRDRWAWLRWGRATRMMADRSLMEDSRDLLDEIAPDLHGTRRVMARAAASSAPAWETLAASRRLRHTVITRLRGS